VSDVLRGIEIALTLYVPDPTPVVLPTPAYPPFFQVLNLTRRRAIETPLVLSDGKYCLDLERIEDGFRAGARSIILCHPHNPVGRSFHIGELAALAEIVDRHGARVISDEVHAPLTYADRRHAPYATVNDASATHAITLTSASKGWNIPGLKCAQVILNRTDLEVWRGDTPLRAHSMGPLGILGNIAAFRNGGPWLSRVMTYLDGNRHLLEKLLIEHLPEVGWIMPEATYLAWLDCRRLGLDEGPADFFLQRAQVALNAGGAFGETYGQFARLNFATSRAILEQAVVNMARAVKS
jgi:cystathionine beta-lyase